MDIRDEEDARARVQQRLQHGERIVWIGQPDPAVNFTGMDAFLIPWGILWLGFVVVGFASFLHAGSAGFAEVIFGVFLLFGLYYLFGRFVYKRWNKRRTVYAITNLRAIVLTGSRKISEQPASGLALTIRLSRNHRHETVIFGAPPPFSLFMQRNYFPNTGLDPLYFLAPVQVAFYDVADVDGLSAALDKSREVPKDRIANA